MADYEEPEKLPAEVVCSLEIIEESVEQGAANSNPEANSPNAYSSRSSL